MVLLKHITAAGLIAFVAGCAAWTSPGPDTGAIVPRVLPSTGGEEGFALAMNSFRAGQAEAAYQLSFQVAERFPDTPWYRRSLLLMERALIRLGRTDQAEVMMLRVQQEYPEMADYAVLLLADHHASCSRFTRAAALYQHLAERWPDGTLAPLSRYRQARMLLEVHAYPQAAGIFESLLQVDALRDLAPDVALGLARALTGAMDLQGAVRAYQDAYVAYPGDPRDDEILAALALFRDSGIEVPALTADQLAARGTSLFRARSYEKAAAAFDAALTMEPRHPLRAEISLKIGVSLFHLGRRAEATQALERSLEENKRGGRGAETLAWLGKSYSRMGDRQKAVKTYLRLVSDYPESEWADDALYLIGNIYRDANDRENTVKFYDRLSEEFPSSSFADSAIWWKAWFQYLAGDYGKSEQTLRTLTVRYPRSFLVSQAVYWQGRACERRGDPRAAADRYRRVNKRSPYTYYGYLAAERLSLIERESGTSAEPVSATDGADADTADGEPDPGWFDDEGPPVWTDEALQVLAADPGFRKVLELMHLEMKEEAASELWALQQGARNRRGTLLGLSKTFFELGDYYRSFLLVARNYEKRLEGPAAGTPRDLWLLAYPQGYWGPIVSQARAYGQDPYFIAAIIRQESHFQADALSPAGARGLMQVMPSTGEWAARMIRLEGYGDGKLYDVDMNVRLGTWYVSRLMNRYHDDPFLAAAAYNAGPVAVSSWLEKYGASVEKDELVELIPYTETRWYVKRVLTNYAEYRRIYARSGRQVRFLAARANAAAPPRDEEIELP